MGRCWETKTSDLGCDCPSGRSKSLRSCSEGWRSLCEDWHIWRLACFKVWHPLPSRAVCHPPASSHISAFPIRFVYRRQPRLAYPQYVGPGDLLAAFRECQSIESCSQSELKCWQRVAGKGIPFQILRHLRHWVHDVVDGDLRLHALVGHLVGTKGHTAWSLIGASSQPSAVVHHHLHHHHLGQFKQQLKQGPDNLSCNSLSKLARKMICWLINIPFGQTEKTMASFSPGESQICFNGFPVGHPRYFGPFAQPDMAPSDVPAFAGEVGSHADHETQICWST